MALIMNLHGSASTLTVEQEVLPHHVVKVEPQVEPASEIQEKVVELVSLQAENIEFSMEKTLKRIADLKKELQVIANAEGNPNEPYTFTSDLGKVVFTKAANTTDVNSAVALLDHLYEKFGDEAVEQCVTVKITDLKKFLSENELKPFVTEGKGSRTCKVTLNPVSH